MDLLRENDAGDMLVIGGGIIPEEHIPILKEKGVAEIFGPGTLIKKIAEYIKENVRKGV